METIGEIADALRAGTVTAEALLERSLERIARLDPEINAFVHVDAEGARRAARESDARISTGRARSALDGVPLSIKDNILVAGMPATWGSRGLADFVPEVDELPIARLRAAGAVFVGKTNVPELTLEGYTKNDLFGVTRNPWDLRLTPGGSSGGAAASVAAGMVAAAIGTDGGGSIRRPACHTGLVGWKPSTGRIPRIDGLPNILVDFESIGTLTRSLDDIAPLEAAMAGPDPRDRRSLLAPRPAPEASSALGRGLRILHIPQFGAAPVDGEVASATAAIAEDLARAGHDVTRGEVFFDIEEAARIWFVISRAGAAAAMHWREGRLRAGAGAAAVAMAADGDAITGAEVIDALDRVAAMRRRTAELFDTVDFVLTPTAGALPWAAEEPYPTVIDGRAAGPRDHATFTGWVNITGGPAVSLPVAISASGLPIGVQFASAFGRDGDLFAFTREVATGNPAPLPRRSRPADVSSIISSPSST